MRRLLVPDASVILKWVLPPEGEPEWGSARKLLVRFIEGEVDLAVPSLWYFEAGNTLARRFPPAIAEKQLHELTRLSMHEVPPGDGWGPVAIGLCGSFGITFYDASYHAVALHLGGTLVTADRTMFRKVRSKGAIVELGSLALE